MFKMFKKITALAMAAVTAGALGLSAFADRVPIANGQNKNNWCWAAASKIVAEHNGGNKLSTDPAVLEYTDGLHSYNGVQYYGISGNSYTADGVQHAIVMEIKGDDKDAGGKHPQDVEAALQYASKGNMNIETIGDDVNDKRGIERNPLTASQISDIQNELGAGRYVLATLRDKTNNYGHAVVICDYRSYNNSYRVLDPWDLTDLYYKSDTIFANYGFRIDNLRQHRTMQS